MNNEGKIIILIGASGSGKTTVYNMMKKKSQKVYIPIYTTTRQKRINEKAGENYYFCTKENFEKEKNQFLYVYCCHGFMYGIPKDIKKYYKNGYTVILGVSRKLISSIKAEFRNTLVGYIDVDYDELQDRIKKRDSSISDNEIIERCNKSYQIIEWANSNQEMMDFIIRNKGQLSDLEKKIDEVILEQKI